MDILDAHQMALWRVSNNEQPRSSGRGFVWMYLGDHGVDEMSGRPSNLPAWPRKRSKRGRKNNLNQKGMKMNTLDV